MQAIEQVNHFLRHIGHHLNLDLELDDDGVCAVEDEDGMRWVIEVPYLSDTVVLLAPMLPLTPDIPPSFFRKLLTSHLHLKTLKGAYFAVDDQKSLLLLSISRPVNALDPIYFTNLFFNFMALSIELSVQVQIWLENPTDDNGKDSPPDGLTFLDRV